MFLHGSDRHELRPTLRPVPTLALDMGVPARDFVDVVRMVFTTRLLRPGQSTPVLLHERLRVTNALGEEPLVACRPWQFLRA
jgi:hypothetical protein